MAELILQISVSLDGYIEDANHSIDWMVEDVSLDPVSTQTLRDIDGMIIGRKTFSLFAEFWPSAGEAEGASPDLIAQAALMNTLPKYVLTHGRLETDWANAHAIGAGDVPRLKREAKRPLALFAGASAAQALLDQVDEIRLTRYPILLGAGTPLFAADGKRRQFTTTDIRAFESGAVIETYRPAP